MKCREFEVAPETTLAALKERWEARWNTLFKTIESLKLEYFDSIIPIRVDSTQWLRLSNARGKVDAS